jgi:hypothetical protein
MVFKDEQAIFDYIRANQKASKYIIDARKYSRKWMALYDGDDFVNVLISQILGIEGQKKAKIRAKCARDIRDFFARLSIPRQNVWAATGGNKDYDYGPNKLPETAKKELLSFVTNTKDNKSVEQYLSTTWDKLYHTDPAGVLYVEVKSDDEGTTDMYPTYKSINCIRHYISCGQKTECILFEPVPYKDPVTKKNLKIWIVADDEWEYRVIQDGDNYTVDKTDDTTTFKHEFGWCPALIISDLTDKKGNRISPYHEIEGVATEYATDLSVFTIYKRLHGFPKSAQMKMACGTCKGVRKADEVCKECGNTGWRKGLEDVADVAVVPFPKDKDSPQIDIKNLFGYFGPDLPTWKQMREELGILFDEAYEAIWGVQPRLKIEKTATEMQLDLQPMINKLLKYSNPAEWLEHTLTEMYANRLNISKDKDVQISFIKYGHLYILVGLDTIQENYLKAKAANANITILDGLFYELLLLKYKADPVYYDMMLKKSILEPHLHLGIIEVQDIFGKEEAAKKEFFSKWWKTVEVSGDAITKEIDDLTEEFNTEFESYYETISQPEPPPTPIPIPVPPTPIPAAAAK